MRSWNPKFLSFRKLIFSSVYIGKSTFLNVVIYNQTGEDGTDGRTKQNIKNVPSIKSNGIKKNIFIPQKIERYMVFN